MKQLLLSGLLLLIAVTVAAAGLPCGEKGTRQVAAGYVAPDGKRLEACFDLDANRVVIRLPDSEIVSLPSAVSGSGARYSDEKRTFWEHQGVGRYFVGEKLLFEGKPAQPAGYSGGVSSRLLKQTTVTANGQKIVYPATDKPEITASLVEIGPGAETGWHKHPVPVYAYMLEGELEVELENGTRIVYKAGDAIIEVVDTFHTGKNRGQIPARLVVFYTGSAGQPNVIRK